jgi:hypothetical protein
MREPVGIRHPVGMTEHEDRDPAVERVFISYAGPDREWADWVAGCLRDAGYHVDASLDWGTGQNFVMRMNAALEGRSRVVCLFSEDYFKPGRFTWDEWTAVLADPDRAGRLVPLRLSDVPRPAILRPLIYRDLFDLDEQAARAVLLEAVSGRRVRASRPIFPPSR